MTVPLRQLVDALRAEFARSFTLDSVLEVLRAHPVDPTTLDSYLDFRDDKYTRNLAYRDDLFEVIVLCWESGQVSRIHNHAGQSCWMAAPIGELQVVNYRVIEGSEEAGHCKLERTDDFWLGAAAPGLVDPDQPIHSVGNPRERGQRAVSIHVYSHPYDHCMIYRLDDDVAEDVPLTYDNEVGLPA